MTAINIINSNDIDEYLKRFCEGDSLLETLLVSAMSNIIKKNSDSIEEIKELPENAPSWLVDKWDTQKSWQKFNDKKDIYLAGRVYHTVVWLIYAIKNEVDWIKNTDEQGRPYKLLKIASYAQLDTVMDKDLKQISKKKRKSAEQVLKDNKDNIDDFEPVMTFDDGHYIVKLKTSKALDIEGDYLEHCIGDGDFDYCLGGNVTEFYSLRDEHNLPCVSICVEKHDGYYYMVQASGQRNALPKGKHIPYLATFCNEGNIAMWDAFRFEDGFTVLNGD